MKKHTIAITFPRDVQSGIISDSVREKMTERFNVMSPEKTGKVSLQEATELLQQADACITGWGSPRFTAELLAQTPNLRIIAHAAGTVKPYVSDAVYDRNIIVTSANQALAIHVADFTLGVILTSVKNLMELSPALAQGRWGYTPEMFKRPDEARGCTVGVISASQVGRCLLKLLPIFNIKALVYDPYITAEQSRELNAEKVELDDLFERSDIVSCHAPSIPATHHMVNSTRLAKMKQGSILINTARGSCLDEVALVEELKKKRIWAFLDVFDPEPPKPESPLYRSPNLTMMPHIAGAVGRGQKDMGAQAYKEVCAFFDGQNVEFPVTQKMLATLA